MNTSEKIKHAEKRIKELELLINHWTLSKKTSGDVDLKLVEVKANISSSSLAA